MSGEEPLSRQKQHSGGLQEAGGSDAASKRNERRMKEWSD
jgi:hypothetical protein